MAGRLCPWWVGYFLASPLRKLLENPHKMLDSFIEPGMKVLDVGCAMGFFSLEAAKMVGPEGQVFAVDLQERMIKSLKRRASRAGLSDRIDARVCHENSLDISDLAGNMDLALAIHVVHEISDVPRLMTEIFSSLKPGGCLFVIEPKGHSSNDEFTAMISHAVKAGFTVVGHPKIKRDRAVVFAKNSHP